MDCLETVAEDAQEHENNDRIIVEDDGVGGGGEARDHDLDLDPEAKCVRVRPREDRLLFAVVTSIGPINQSGRDLT